jgi:hypothetical protein
VPSHHLGSSQEIGQETQASQYLLGSYTKTLVSWKSYASDVCVYALNIDALRLMASFDDLQQLNARTRSRFMLKRCYELVPVQGVDANVVWLRSGQI